MRLTKDQMDALQNIKMYLIQKVIGVLCVVTPFVLNNIGFLSDDSSPGLAFILTIPLGLWLFFTDDIVF